MGTFSCINILKSNENRIPLSYKSMVYLHLKFSLWCWSLYARRYTEVKKYFSVINKTTEGILCCCMETEQECFQWKE